MSTDLWPDFEAEKVKNPKSFLVEQANFLSEKTKNVLLAEVKSKGDITKKILHSFDIVAPALSNYRFNLFHIQIICCRYSVMPVLAVEYMFADNIVN